MLRTIVVGILILSVASPVLAIVSAQAPTAGVAMLPTGRQLPLLKPVVSLYAPVTISETMEEDRKLPCRCEADAIDQSVLDLVRSGDRYGADGVDLVPAESNWLPTATRRLRVVSFYQTVDLGYPAIVEGSRVRALVSCDGDDVRIRYWRAHVFPGVGVASRHRIPEPLSERRRAAALDLGVNSDEVILERNSVAFIGGEWRERHLARREEYRYTLERRANDVFLIDETSHAASGTVTGQVRPLGAIDSTAVGGLSTVTVPFNNRVVIDVEYDECTNPAWRAITDGAGLYAFDDPTQVGDLLLIQFLTDVNAQFGVALTVVSQTYVDCDVQYRYFDAGEDVFVDALNEVRIAINNSGHHGSELCLWTNAITASTIIPDTSLWCLGAEDVAIRCNDVSPFGIDGASWDRVNIIFLGAGDIWSNLASSDVLAHEFGHYLDDRAGGQYNSQVPTSAGLSEGWGDLVSTWFTDQPLVGIGYLRGDPSSFLRDVSANHQYCDFDPQGAQPCPGLDIHEYGVVFAAFGWDLRKSLQAMHGDSGGDVVARELALATMLMDPMTIPEAIQDMVAVDDLANGGAHRNSILCAAEGHGIPHGVSGGCVVVGIDEPASLPKLALEQNHPNPFNPATRIAFSLHKDAPVTLSIHDVAGRLLTTLIERRMSAGPHVSEWDGRDASGKRVASGVYFYRLTAGDQTLTRKAVLLK